MKKLLCISLAVLLLLTGCGAGGADVTEPTQPTQLPYEANHPEMPTLPENATDEQILQYRRDLVEQEMRYMCTVRWTPAETIQYSLVNNSNGLDADRVSNPDDIITLQQGVIYEGIPYTHGANSSYAFLEYATSETENGALVLSNLGASSLSGFGKQHINRCARIGTDCADQVFWAWSQVSDSINFDYTAEMTRDYGCIPVGDYVNEESKYSYTGPIVGSNGPLVMFESYAQMRKGDALVMLNSGGSGHAIMNVEVHVVRDAEGIIDGRQSYAVILEQESGDEREQNDTYIDEVTGERIVRLQGIDRKYPFYVLFEKGYLPVTCKELIDPAPLTEVTLTDSVQKPSIDNIFEGVVSSPYRISYVTVEIKDDKGATVQKCTTFAYAPEMREFQMERFTNAVEKLVQHGFINLDELPSGTYTVTHTARLSNGDKVTFRNFSFTN